MAIYFLPFGVCPGTKLSLTVSYLLPDGGEIPVVQNRPPIPRVSQEPHVFLFGFHRLFSSYLPRTYSSSVLGSYAERVGIAIWVPERMLRWKLGSQVRCWVMAGCRQSLSGHEDTPP